MHAKVTTPKVTWNVPANSQHPEEGKNYKVISDPQLRLHSEFIYRYNGISTNNHEPILVCDPRGQSSQRRARKKPTGLLIPDYALESYLGRPLIRHHADNSFKPVDRDLRRQDGPSPSFQPPQFRNPTFPDFAESSATFDLSARDKSDKLCYHESRKHRHTSHECETPPRKRKRHHHRMNHTRGPIASSHSSNISTPNLPSSDGVGRSSDINSPQFSSTEPKESLDSRIANLLGNRPNPDQAGSIGGVQQILQTGPTQNFVLNPMFVQGGVVNIPYYEPNINVPPPIAFQPPFTHGHPSYMNTQSSTNQFP